MATKTKSKKAAKKTAAPATRVVVPGVLVQVRANPRFFAGKSEYPWLVKEAEAGTAPVDDAGINEGWLEARDLTFAGRVTAEASTYEADTWSCGVKSKTSKRAAYLSTRDGCEYRPGPKFVGG